MTTVPITTGSPPPIDTAFVRGIGVFDDVLARVPDHMWDAPSPCTEWTARDVVGHVIGTMSKGAAVLRGEPYPSDPSRPGDAAGDDPLSAWREIADSVRTALTGVDLTRVLDSPSGKRTVAEGLRFPAADLAVHAWDVATATGQRLQLSDELLAHIMSTSQQVPEDVLRGPDLFGPARQAPADADDTLELMAWLGRDPVSVTDR